jgi:hypothetical protein
MKMTREDLKAEIEEKKLDLDAFLRARDIIRARVIEVADSGCKLTPLPNWSGTDAVLGSLDLSIHAMERTIEELQRWLKAVEDEGPKLKLVTNEETEE